CKHDTRKNEDMFRAVIKAGNRQIVTQGSSLPGRNHVSSFRYRCHRPTPATNYQTYAIPVSTVPVPCAKQTDQHAGRGGVRTCSAVQGRRRSGATASLPKNFCHRSKSCRREDGEW